MTGAGNQFDAVFTAFGEYRVARKRFIEAMRPCGIATGNVDPLVDFAEIVVAREFDGQIQRRTNKDVDVIAQCGLRIQVKSLRVSSDRPADNPLNWYLCTRRKAKVGDDLPLIEPDLLAIVVFIDSDLYALLTFPITLVDRFPAAGMKDLFVSHVNKLLNDPESAASGGVQVKNLRQP